MRPSSGPRTQLSVALGALLCLLGCKPRVDVIARAIDAGVIVRDGGRADAGRDDAGVCSSALPGADAGERTRELERVLERAGARAICACDGITAAAGVETDRKREDGSVNTAATAKVDVNTELSAGGVNRIGGALTVAGSGGISLSGENGAPELHVAGSLEVGGPLQGPGSVNIAGDASVADRIELAALVVAGTLTQPDGASINVSGRNSASVRRSADVSVATPCACDADSRIPFAQRPGAAAEQVALSKRETRLDRACGEYVMGEFDPAGVVLSVQQSSALYIDSDLHLDGDLVIDTAERADLDLFIAKGLRVDGALRVGTGARSGRVRIFVGTSGTAQLAGGELHGVLYAPQAELVVSGELTVYGTLSVRRISATAPLHIHHLVD